MKLSIIKFIFFIIEAYLHLTLDAVSNPEEFVRPLAGSFTDGDKFSTGNTLPLIGFSFCSFHQLNWWIVLCLVSYSFISSFIFIGRPWGFNHWSPQTKDANRFTWSWGFKGSDHVFKWLRCTHQPSPWIGRCLVSFHTYTYIHIHTCIHTYIHTYILLTTILLIGDWGYFVFTPILTHWGQGVTRDPEHYWEPRGFTQHYFPFKYVCIVLYVLYVLGLW